MGVKIGIIGCGQIAQQHFKTYAQIPDATVVACADIREEARFQSAAEFNVARSYTTAQEMLENEPDLDAVDVCLHNNLHRSGVEAVLAAGKPVYCEKPMAGTYADAVAMQEAAKKAGQMLHIQLAGLYRNEVRAAKSLIDAGELGELYHARSTGHRRRGRPFVDGYGRKEFVSKMTAAGGALFDMGVYHVTEILHLLGNPTPERISGKTYQKMDMDAGRRAESGFNVEEIGMGFVRFANSDVSLDIIEAWSCHMNGFEGSFILGSKGGVRINPFEFHRSYDDLDVSGTGGMDAFQYRLHQIHEQSDYSESQRHWVAALQGKVPLLPTAEIALNHMLISEGIYLSEKLGREVTAQEVKEHSASTVLPL